MEKKLTAIDTADNGGRRRVHDRRFLVTGAIYVGEENPLGAAQRLRPAVQTYLRMSGGSEKPRKRTLQSFLRTTETDASHTDGNDAQVRDDVHKNFSVICFEF